MLANRLGMKGMEMEIIAWKEDDGMGEGLNIKKKLGQHSRPELTHTEMASRMNRRRTSALRWSSQTKDIATARRQRGEIVRRSRFSSMGCTAKNRAKEDRR